MDSPFLFPPPNPAMLDDVRRRLAKYALAYQTLVTEVIMGLAGQGDMDMKFLSVRINFSLKYRLGRSGKDKERERDKER